MMRPHLAEDDELLVSYLYDECGAAERRRIDDHLAECERCAFEVQQLQVVRGALGDWTPPSARLGFRIVQDPPGSLWRWTGGALPAWAQAAAAVLLFVIGTAVAGLEVRYGADGLTVRTGWRRAASAPVQAPSAVRPAAVEPGGAAPSARVQGTASAAAAPSNLSALEQTLRRDLAAAPRPGASPAQVAQENDAVLRRVQMMIEQSERRQQRELALRLMQVIRDMDAQRRADLLRVEQNFGQLEGQAGAAVAQQRELLNYLVRVSQQQ